MSECKNRKLCIFILATIGLPPHALSAATLTVGPGQAFSTISAAVAAASANDVIDVQAGTYVNDFPVINVPLTINGVGGVAILQATEFIPNEKGIVLENADATLNNLEFEGAAVSDDDGGNGAGIRYQGGNLTIENCIFQSNQEGILATPNVAGTGVIGIDHSTFNNNGSSSGEGAGYTHALYVGDVASLTVQNSTFNGTQVGHDIKSRAPASIVANNYLDDGVTGTASYAIDIPNGGNATITGNQIVKGPNTQNPAMIAYGEEGETYASNSLLVENNILTSSFAGQSVGVFNHTTDVSAELIGNTFTNVVTPLIGPGTISNAPTSPTAPSPLYAAVLPGSRSVQLGNPATVFATVLNAGSTSLSNCSIALPGSVPSQLSLAYQTTDPTTNAVTGAANSSAVIAGGGSQSFVLIFRASSAISLQAQPLVAICDGVTAAPVITGVDTIDLIFSATPITDIVALAATQSNDGILTVPFSQAAAAAFAVATDNVGAAGTITVSIDTGGVALPIAATICQTNPSTAQCLAPPAGSVTQSFTTGGTPTFSIFVSATAQIAFAPASSRIFVRFADGSGISHGSTSLAIRTN